MRDNISEAKNSPSKRNRLRLNGAGSYGIIASIRTKYSIKIGPVVYSQTGSVFSEDQNLLPR